MKQNILLLSILTLSACVRYDSPLCTNENAIDVKPHVGRYELTSATRLHAKMAIEVRDQIRAGTYDSLYRANLNQKAELGEIDGLQMKEQLDLLPTLKVELKNLNIELSAGERLGEVKLTRITTTEKGAELNQQTPHQGSPVFRVCEVPDSVTERLGVTHFAEISEVIPSGETTYRMLLLTKTPQGFMSTSLTSQMSEGIFRTQTSEDQENFWSLVSPSTDEVEIYEKVKP